MRESVINSTSIIGTAGTGLSLTISQWSDVAGIVVAALTGGYVIYRWVRDARERTCDKSGCPMRHRPE